MKRIAVVLVLAIGVLGAAFGLSGCQELRETPAQGADRLIVWSEDTLRNFARLPELKEFAKTLPDARAVMVLPALVKAGFFLGAEGGSGVLIARRADGSWGYPAFYTLGAASIGIQFGIQDTETVLVIRNDGALRSIIKNQGKFGADLGVTPYGTETLGVLRIETTRGDTLITANDDVKLEGERIKLVSNAKLGRVSLVAVGAFPGTMATAT